MNRIAILTALLLAAASFGGEPAAPPGDDLSAPDRLLCDGKPIDVDVGHATPLVVDWDRDGKRDLLVSQFGEGRLRFYRNDGTAKEPKLAEPKVLLAREGPFEKACRFKPAVTDWNGDGLPDLVVGVGVPGEEKILHGWVQVCPRKPREPAPEK